MFTHRQSWRREGNGIVRGPRKDIAYNELCNNSGEVGVGRSQSDPTLSLSPHNNGGILRRLFRTTGSLNHEPDNYEVLPSNMKNNTNKSNMANANKKKNRVRWNLGVRVVLIPTRNEYVDAKLSDDMWWTEGDYSVFKSSAVEELKSIMKILRVDSRKAMDALYQIDGMDKLQREFGKNSLDSSDQSKLLQDQSDGKSNVPFDESKDSSGQPSVLLLSESTAAEDGPESRHWQGRSDSRDSDIEMGYDGAQVENDIGSPESKTSSPFVEPGDAAIAMGVGTSSLAPSPNVLSPFMSSSAPTPSPLRSPAGSLVCPKPLPPSLSRSRTAVALNAASPLLPSNPLIVDQISSSSSMSVPMQSGELFSENHIPAFSLSLNSVSSSRVHSRNGSNVGLDDSSDGSQAVTPLPTPVTPPSSPVTPLQRPDTAVASSSTTIDDIDSLLNNTKGKNVIPRYAGTQPVLQVPLRPTTAPPSLSGISGNGIAFSNEPINLGILSAPGSCPISPTQLEGYLKALEQQSSNPKSRPEVYPDSPSSATLGLLATATDDAQDIKRKLDFHVSSKYNQSDSRKRGGSNGSGNSSSNRRGLNLFGIGSSGSRVGGTDSLISLGPSLMLGADLDQYYHSHERSAGQRLASSGVGRGIERVKLTRAVSHDVPSAHSNILFNIVESDDKHSSLCGDLHSSTPKFVKSVS